MRLLIFHILFFFCLIFEQNISAQTTWVKHPSPVLERSATFPDWKGLATGDPFVMLDNDTLKMWYAGVGWVSAFDDCPHVRIGYAWSIDGINWNEYANNPVLNINPDTSMFDADGVETPTVIKDESAPPEQRYKMWYAGRKSRCLPINDHHFGYAYSPDGLNWTKYEGNPVMSPGNPDEWFNTFISSPCVIYDEFTYKMWFTASDLVINGQETDGKGNIGYAISTDGINWTIYPYPIVEAGNQDNYDSVVVAEPSVVKIGSFYHLFYSMLNSWDIENFQVGYAISNDAITFTKSTLNPVLKIGEPGSWDAFWAAHPTVIYDENSGKFKMWYTGRDKSEIVDLENYFWDIGYAESYMPNAITEQNENGVQVFPNPATNIIYVLNGTPGATVEIYNLNGVLITTETMDNQFAIQISNLPQGIYFLNLPSAGNTKYTFIKL